MPCYNCVGTIDATRGLTRHQLLTALFASGTVYVDLPKPGRATGSDHCVLLSVEREDGSGRCFNLRLKDAFSTETFTRFVRTID